MFSTKQCPNQIEASLHIFPAVYICPNYFHFITYTIVLLQEFGEDNTPLSESEFTLPLLPRNNKTSALRMRMRNKRSMDKRDNPIRIRVSLDQAHLDDIISTLNLSGRYIYFKLFYNICVHGALC